MASTPPSTPPTPVHQNNALDDIYSTSRSPSPSASIGKEPVARFTDGSEIPRLRRIQVTAGQREGAASVKEASFQSGFIETHPLGGSFGLRIGCLLGMLEGMVRAYGPETDADSVRGKERDRMQALWGRASEELAIGSIFNVGLYWAEDGTWAYEVPEEKEGESATVTWKEVVDNHPLVKRWERIVDEEFRRTGLRKDVFSGEEWEAGRVGEGS